MYSLNKIRAFRNESFKNDFIFQDFRVFAYSGCVVTPLYHLEFLVIGTIVTE
jgi:hypothetical protein